MPCSISEGEEGFGSNVLCSACWFDDLPTEESETAHSTINNEIVQSEENCSEIADESLENHKAIEVNKGIILFSLIRK